MADSGGPGSGTRWRVFVSHTSELRDFPAGGSYVGAAERAISACGHVVVDMADFPAADQVPAEMCRERVRGCEVYVGVLGTRYGSPVRDEPDVSYTELEFDTATEAGLPRLVFLLDTGAADVGIPLSRLIDVEFGARQEAFRRRVQECGLVTQVFADPATLGQLVERSLRELAEQHRRRDSGGGQGSPVPAVVVAGEIPQEPLGFQPRADLLAALDAPGPDSRASGGACADRDARGGQDPSGGGLCPGQAGGGLAAGGVGQRRGSGRGAGGPGRGRRGAGPGRGAGMRRRRAGRCGTGWKPTGSGACWCSITLTDPELLRPFLPAAGAARVIITSNQQAVANLGAGVPVDVFTESEALTFLAARTGQADAAGAQELRPRSGLPAAGAGAGRRGDRRPAPVLCHLPGAAAPPAGR